MKTTRTHLLIALAGALFLCSNAVSEPIISRTQALTTGTAYRVAPNSIRANSLFVQSLAGNSAIVYVLYADASATCSTSTTTQIVAQLGPGNAGQPGQSFTFPSNTDGTTQAGGFDAQRFCVAGTSGDSTQISYEVRQ